MRAERAAEDKTKRVTKINTELRQKYLEDMEANREEGDGFLA